MKKNIPTNICWTPNRSTAVDGHCIPCHVPRLSVFLIYISMCRSINKRNVLHNWVRVYLGDYFVSSRRSCTHGALTLFNFYVNFYSWRPKFFPLIGESYDPDPCIKLLVPKGPCTENVQQHWVPHKYSNRSLI